MPWGNQERRVPKTNRVSVKPELIRWAYSVLENLKKSFRRNSRNYPNGKAVRRNRLRSSSKRLLKRYTLTRFTCLILGFEINRIQYPIFDLFPVKSLNIWVRIWRIRSKIARFVKVGITITFGRSTDGNKISIMSGASRSKIPQWPSLKRCATNWISIS